MKAAILHGPGDLRIEELELDTDVLGPHDVWTKTVITAFKIGTDGGNYAGAEKVAGAPDYPRRVGDSNLGIVQGVGDKVTRFKVGDRVVSNSPHRSDLVINEFEHIVKVPDGVADEDAVFAHLYTLSSLCYRKANFQIGENVAVIGLGLLGQGAVALGPLIGARVAALGNDEGRNEMAMKMGAHAAYMSDDPDLQTRLDGFTNGKGIDLVILAANPWPAYRTAMETVRPNGRVSVLSLLGRGEAPLDFNPLAMEWFYLKGISLIAVKGTAAYPYPPEEDEDRFSWNRACEFVLSLMADGGLEPKRLLTHRFNYTDMVEAYEMAVKQDMTMLNVVFDWRDAQQT